MDDDKLYIKFGSLRELKIDPTTILVKEFKLMYKGLNDVKKTHHPLVRNPLQTFKDPETGEDKQESLVEWKGRVMKEYLDGCQKKDGEDDEHYDKRILSVALRDSKSTIAFEFVNKICEILKLDPITQEQFDEASWEQVRMFCNNLLIMGEVSDPDGLFRPPQREN